MTLARFTAPLTDWAMCALMFAIQRRHRLHANSRAELERYIAAHEPQTRDTYFAAPALDAAPSTDRQSQFTFSSAIASGFAENDRVRIDLFPCAAGWAAPTVLMLHALMSASDFGYRRWAADFNARGWNACFIHLPYHYSRKPRGRWNGELCITADCVRTAEGLRQGVSDLRRLMARLREWGCREFALWASSYGGWIGALLLSVERDFRWAALMEPIVDVGHAIWVSPAGAAMRRELHPNAIDHALIERHFHLVSPLHGMPMCGADRVLFCAGKYDRIARAEDIARLHAQWRGSELTHVAQGHFGYKMMRTMWRRVNERGLLQT